MSRYFNKNTCLVLSAACTDGRPAICNANLRFLALAPLVAIFNLVSLLAMPSS